jgi:two-component system response regulator YesN
MSQWWPPHRILHYYGRLFMHKLILVDDEEIVLNSIQKIFQMENYQFEIVGTFTNPRKALDQIKDLSPHLIITDIKMPHMDGLEFASKAKQILPQVQIVVLSGHDDFVYAQTAIKLGISDYLLKPIRKKDFESMLTKMHKKIEAELSFKQQLKALTNTVLSNYAILRNKFFTLLMEQGDALDSNLKCLYDQLGFCFANHNFILVKFVIDEIYVEDDYISIIEKLISEFKEHMQGYGFIEEFYTDEYLYFYMYNLNREHFGQEFFLNSVLQYTKEKNNHGLKLLVGVSQIHSSMYNLFFAGSECDEFILTSGTNLNDNKLPMDNLFSVDSITYFSYSEVESLFLSIFSNDKNKMLESIENILNFPTVSIYKDFRYSVAIIVMIRMYQLQDKYSSQNKYITRDLLKIERLKRLCPTTSQLIKLLIEKAVALADLINSQSVLAPSKTILAAIQYIKNHFNENISLSDLAEHTHISKNYLCDLLKKELNITFIDYITNLRIEKAKYYLSNTDMKMYEISAAVGYNDYAYFSQIFKRHTGISSSNYRKQH